MKSLSLSALPAFLLTPFTSAVAHPEVESKLPEEGLILPSSSLSDLIAPGQFVGGSSRSLGRSTSLTEQEKCSQTLGYQYNATELAQYDPFLALENFNTMGCDYIFGDDERFPGANFTNCDRYDEEIQDAVENLCEYQVENVDFIIWDTRTNDENQEKVPSLIYANQPLCFPPTCDYATIFFLVNVNFLGYFAQDGGLVEMRYSGTSGMECAQSLTRNYGNELFLTADGKLRTDPLEETSLTPYNPDTIFTENCKEYKDPTKKFCNQKGMFEDVRPLCEEIGGTYVEYDIKQLTTDYTYETRKSVSKNVPFCASQKCIPEEAMAYTEYFFQQLFYEQYEFQSSICLENKYSKFEYMDEAALIATGSCSQLRGDKFTAEQKEELCSEHGDLCPASCGKCEEYPNSKFVQNIWKGKVTFKTCDWLSKRSDAVIAKVCARNGFKKTFGPAYSACPYTCGANEDGDEDGTTDPAFQFIQCPETGDCCNGLESNCNLDVNEVFFAAVHNANHDDVLIPNNEAPLEGALEAGYRGLLLDVCKCPNAETNTMEITFCHGVCGVGPRDLTEVFTNINTFLTDNPSELIIVNFEMSVGDATPEEVWEIMKTDNGVRQKTYNHAGGDWPTMGELLADGKQLILFEHNHNENCSDPTNPGCSPRIETFFNHAVETTWVFSNVEEINDYDRSCAEDRGSGGLKYFYSINHFVTATFGPSKSSADVLNEIDSINNRVTECEKLTKHKVSIFSVDYWQRGHLPEVAQTINKSRGKRRRNKRSRFLQWMLG